MKEEIKATVTRIVDFCSLKVPEGTHSPLLLGKSFIVIIINIINIIAIAVVTITISRMIFIGVHGLFSSNATIFYVQCSKFKRCN